MLGFLVGAAYANNAYNEQASNDCDRPPTPERHAYTPLSMCGDIEDARQHYL